MMLHDPDLNRSSKKTWPAGDSGAAALPGRHEAAGFNRRHCCLVGGKLFGDVDVHVLKCEAHTKLHAFQGKGFLSCPLGIGRTSQATVTSGRQVDGEMAKQLSRCEEQIEESWGCPDGELCHPCPVFALGERSAWPNRHNWRVLEWTVDRFCAEFGEKTSVIDTESTNGIPSDID